MPRGAIAGPDSASGIDLVLQTLEKTDEQQAVVDLIGGIQEALAGRRRVATPAAWSQAYQRLIPNADPSVRQSLHRLAALFGDRQVLDEMRSQIANSSADAAERRNAIDILQQVKAPVWRQFCFPCWTIASWPDRHCGLWRPMTTQLRQNRF